MVSADNTAGRDKFCIAQEIYCGDFVASTDPNLDRTHRQKPLSFGPEVLVGSLRRRAQQARWIVGL
jgi:hypothetical protein